MDTLQEWEILNKWTFVGMGRHSDKIIGSHAIHIGKEGMKTFNEHEVRDTFLFLNLNYRLLISIGIAQFKRCPAVGALSFVIVNRHDDIRPTQCVEIEVKDDFSPLL